MSTEFAGLIPREDQERLQFGVLQKLAEGYSRICAHAPTGFGKSLVQFMLADHFLKQGKQVAMLSPRIALVDSAVDWAESSQIPFNVRHDQYKNLANDNARLQICSTMTEVKARNSLGRDELEADVIIVDECHMNIAKGTESCQMLSEANINGTTIIGFTATPMGVSHFYETLQLGPSLRELFRSKVLVPARYYDGGDPCLEKLGVDRLPDGEFNKTKMREIGFTEMIYGSVLKSYNEQNPNRRPWIVFCNGVEESRFMCDRFNESGVNAWHIDGEYVYRNDRETKSMDKRRDLIKMMREGDPNCQVLTCRYVLREGVDIQRLYGVSFACAPGTLKAYVQMVGRAMRAHETKTFCKVIDHAGNRYRFGSPNLERDWTETWEMRAIDAERLFKDRVKRGAAEPGHRCSECGMVWGKLPRSWKCECGNELRKMLECPACQQAHYQMPEDCRCSKCGLQLRRIRKKAVIEIDGTIKHVPDDCMKVPEMKKFDGTEKLWTGRFFGAFKSKKEKYDPETCVFASVRGWFIKLHYEQFHCHPPLDLKHMPVSPDDWYKRLCDLRWSDLIDHVMVDGTIVANSSHGLVVESLKKDWKKKNVQDHQTSN